MGSSENSFIDEKTYDACVDPGRPDLSGSLFIGVDAIGQAGFNGLCLREV